LIILFYYLLTANHIKPIKEKGEKPKIFSITENNEQSK